MTSFSQKIKEGLDLSHRITTFTFSTLKKFPEIDGLGEIEANRAVVAKAFLISGAKLCRQIIHLVSKKCLDLPLIGLRTLLEFNIDANYIFEHPKHKDDLEWIDNLCKDVFDRTNNIELLKSKLGGTDLRKRCESIGAIELYDKNYVSLCDYTHLMLRQSYQQQENEFEKLSVAIISQALCNFMGVIDTITKFENIILDDKLFKDILYYRDQYEIA